MHVHVCSFFQATSHDKLGDPCGGYTCYPAEKTTYDVNRSAMDWRRRQAKKTGVFCLSLFCRSPTGSSCTFTALRWRATDCFRMASEFFLGAEDRQKNRSVLLATLQGVSWIRRRWTPSRRYGCRNCTSSCCSRRSATRRHLRMALKTGIPKPGMLSPRPLLCRYEEFVEYTVDDDSVKTLTKGCKKKNGCIFAW